MIRWRRRRDHLEDREIDALQERFPDVVFHLRDAFDVNRVAPGTEFAYARISRNGDVLSLCSAVHRVDSSMSEWRLAVTRTDKASGAPLALPDAEARQWAIAVFGPIHAESVVTVAAPLLQELPIQYRAATHFALRIAPGGLPVDTAKPRRTRGTR
ncbi:MULTISPECIES: hypothetical protein [unclassified Pseudonocardia]|uniref:hypothetical protein n=1 Tax=unclassified Pseudonocardia TaxID=2619320 RepID=UPI00095BF85C|nr:MULTISPECIES: hypothetical protein [unclassified Pseudonocardia]OLL70719.1 hypothetical protein Ae263Ps1_6133 [Pseudonocardia sp. Ae263_Ps1]